MNFQEVIHTWIDLIFKPKEVIAKKNEEMTKNPKLSFWEYIALPLIFIYVLLIALMLIQQSNFSVSSLIGLIFVFILIFIVICFSLVMFGGVLFVISKLLGGRGKFANILFLLTLMLPFILTTTALGSLVRPDIFGTVGSLLIMIAGIVFLIYSYYLVFLIVRESQKLSTPKALGIMVVLFIINILLTVFKF